MELIVRAKHNDTKEYYYGILNRKASSGVNFLPMSKFWRQIEKGILLLDSLSYFTGVKSKGGGLIFSGDRVRLHYPELSHEDFEGIVEWGSYGDDEYVKNIECWVVSGLPLSDTGELWGAEREREVYLVKV